MNFKNIINKINKKKEKENFLDEEIIENKDVSILFTDSTWNIIFTEDMKTNEIRKIEEELKEILIREQELKSKLQKLPIEKKKHMTEIINLTPSKFDNNDNKAEDKMQKCKGKIEEINQEIHDITLELRNEIIHEKKRLNEALKEACVKVAYQVINNNRQMAAEAAKKIEQTKEQLNILISEKNMQEQNADSLYKYLHGLLGAEKMEELDKINFKK